MAPLRSNQKHADKVIGATLRSIRLSKGMTQQQVADRLHIAQRIISQIETGKRSLRAPEVLVFSYALDVGSKWIFRQITQALYEEGLLDDVVLDGTAWD